MTWIFCFFVVDTNMCNYKLQGIVGFGIGLAAMVSLT